ncbi:hypothetical protein [Natronomonas sp. EA1]|uniref:hypothetical protein n=1 Tax=Natronomonas sp. EA1 TaxID=3421655 RepID=UPI003EBF0299
MATHGTNSDADADADPDPDSDPFSDYPNRIGGEEGARLVGRDTDGALYYFDAERRVLVSGAPEEVPDPEWQGGRQLSREESLTDVIRDVEGETGWDALTGYAKRVRGE